MRLVYKSALIVIGICVSLNASGYKIPEQSLSALALSAANVAAVDGSDASYYNPAGMAFLTNPRHELEMGLTYINLPSIKYTDSAITARNGESKKEHFIVPYMHFVTPDVGSDWRFGFSFVAPGGLAKRWDTLYQKGTAKKFSLKVVEANPTASYKINDMFAVGFGARALYTSGIIASEAYGGTPFEASRKLTGDSVDFGYNLAFLVKPLSGLTLASTYRSKVDLGVKGNARLKYSGQPNYDGSASVDAVLPATLNLAVAYTYQKTTLEFVYERVYWSKYKELDFEYSSNLGGGMGQVFDNPVLKNWKDVDTYRVGLTHWYSGNLKLMAGFSIDKNPAPDDTLGFELPDSDAKLYSAGFEYKINEDMSIGAAYLFSDKEKRSVQNNDIHGTTSKGGAHLATISFKYRF